VKHCKCGYVPGATTGYDPLTPVERQTLLGYGYEIDTNVHGDEIARPLGRRAYNTARFELHQIACRPTRYQILGS